MIKLLCVGKLKEKYLIDFVNDYKKRISKYHKIEIIELKDFDTLDKERDEMQKIIKPNDFVISLCIEGNSLSSESYAKLIEETFNHYGTITFVIGSSLGIHEDIKNRSNYKLSFSKLTFPHGVFRGILLESIYRSFKIINNETYHK